MDFPEGGYIRNIEQVKLDSLGINILLISANTVDLDGKDGMDWKDPEQLLLVSTDGKSKTALTDPKFYTSTWLVHRNTGTIVITGHYASKGNNKYDKTDRNEILIFDLKTLKLIRKI